MINCCFECALALFSFDTFQGPDLDTNRCISLAKATLAGFSTIMLLILPFGLTAKQ